MSVGNASPNLFEKKRGRIDNERFCIIKRLDGGAGLRLVEGCTCKCHEELVE